jgi:hypothetical protein
MAEFLAMRVNSRKLEYKDVPDKYKQKVHDILINKYGWSEEDFTNNE